jgi:hypothetical protein
MPHTIRYLESKLGRAIHYYESYGKRRGSDFRMIKVIRYQVTKKEYMHGRKTGLPLPAKRWKNEERVG